MSRRRAPRALREADFAGALGDGDEHDVLHDADAADAESQLLR